MVLTPQPVLVLGTFFPSLAALLSLTHSLTQASRKSQQQPQLQAGSQAGTPLLSSMPASATSARSAVTSSSLSSVRPPLHLSSSDTTRRDEPGIVRQRHASAHSSSWPGQEDSDSEEGEESDAAQVKEKGGGAFRRKRPRKRGFQVLTRLACLSLGTLAWRSSRRNKWWPRPVEGGLSV